MRISRKTSLLAKFLKISISVLIAFFVLFSGIFALADSGAPTLTTLTFTDSGSWSVPAGITTFKVKLWGAGGKGGDGALIYDGAGHPGPGGGGGGGAGGYVEKTFTGTANSTFDFTIGEALVNDGTTVFKDSLGGILLGAIAGGTGVNGVTNGTAGAGGTGGGSLTGTNPDLVVLGSNGAAGQNGAYNFSCNVGFSQAGPGGPGGSSSIGSGGTGGLIENCVQFTSTLATVGGLASGGGGGAGYPGPGNVGALGGKGQVVIEYSVPVAPAPPTISCNVAGITPITFGSNIILAWPSNTATTTVLQSSLDGSTWTNVPTAPTLQNSCNTVTVTPTTPETSYRLFDATPAPVPPTPPTLPTISCATSGLTPINFGNEIILAWPTSTATTTVLQSSTDSANWSNVATSSTIINSCNTLTVPELTPDVFYRLFDTTTPVVPPTTPPTISCTASGITSIASTTTSTILAWATTTPGTLQSSPDGLTWTYVPTAPIIQNSCNTVTVTPTVPETLYRLNNPIPIVDSTAPVITILGSNPMHLVQGSNFTDPGATAVDNVDGPVGVVISGDVINSGTPLGGYTIIYTATDTAGNIAVATRIVIVDAPITISCSVSGITSIPSGNEIILAWPLIPANKILQSSLDSSNWTDVATTSTVQNGCNTVVVNQTTPETFYQLIDSLVSTFGISLSANPTSGPAPLNGVSFTASLSGTATGTVDYQLDCASDGNFDFATSSSASPFVSEPFCNYPNQGAYQMFVRATRGGVVATSTTSVTATAPVGGNTGSTTLFLNFSINPTFGTAPLNNIGFNATVSGTAVGTTTYSFDCQNNGSFEMSTSTLATSISEPVFCNYTIPGNYVVLAQVSRDSVFAQATTSVTVFAQGAQPTISLGLTPSATSGTTPLGVSFDVAVGGTAGGTASFGLDCSTDGTDDYATSTDSLAFSTGNVCNYTTAGTYLVTAHINKAGVSTTTTASITILAPVVPSSGGGGTPVVEQPVVHAGGGPGGSLGGGPPSFIGVKAGGGPVGTTTPSSSISRPVSSGSCSYLTQYLRVDEENDPLEVVKLQSFLKDTEGYVLDVNGVFDQKTFESVEDFQLRYKEDVLYPWATTTPSGYVFITTSKKINDIYCANNPNYKIAPTPDLTPYLQGTIGTTEGSGGVTTFEPKGQATSTAPGDISTTTPKFDGVIGLTPQTESQGQSVLIRGQANIAAAINAVSDLMISVFDGIRELFKR